MDKYITFKITNDDMIGLNTKYRSSYPAIPSKQIHETKVYKCISNLEESLKEKEIEYDNSATNLSQRIALIVNSLLTEYDMLYNISDSNWYASHCALILKAKADNKLYIAREVIFHKSTRVNKNISKLLFFEIKECEAKVNAAQRKKEALIKARQNNEKLFETLILPSMTDLVEKAGLKINSEHNHCSIFIDPKILFKRIAKILTTAYPNIKLTENINLYGKVKLCTFKLDEFIRDVETIKEI